MGTVAVVGGSGFIGRHVTRSLLAAGHGVVNLDRRVPRGVERGEVVREVDLLVPGAAEAAAAGCGAIDAVVWLAAEIRHRATVDAAALDDVQVMIAAPLAFLFGLPAAPAALVVLSSVQVYGPPRSSPVDEDHPTEPVHGYGVAKLGAEAHLRIAAAALGTPAALLRAAYVYGPGQHPGNVIPRFLAAVRRGEPPVVHGDGGDVRDDVYVGDVARAVLAAIERRAGGTINVAGGARRTILEIAEAACRLGGAGLRPRCVDRPSGWTSRWFAIDRARALLGWEPATSIEDGLAAMWREGAP